MIKLKIVLVGSKDSIEIAVNAEHISSIVPNKISLLYGEPPVDVLNVTMSNGHSWSVLPEGEIDLAYRNAL